MKKLLQAFGLFGMLVFAWICLWTAFAQPVSNVRLRDLQDVRVANPPANNDVLKWDSMRRTWTNGAAAGGGGTFYADTSIDQQIQFNSNNVSAGSSHLRWLYDSDTLAISSGSGSSFIHINASDPFWRLYAGGNPAANYSRLEALWDSANGVYALRENVSGSNAIPFIVGINNGSRLTFNTDGTAVFSGGLGLSGLTNRLTIVSDKLYLDGNPIVSIVNNTITNVNTISNVSYVYSTTNVTDTDIVNNSYVVSGRNASIVITNSARFRWATLTVSGTNASTVSLTNASFFDITLTTNTFIPVPIDLPGTNEAQTIQFHIRQAASGGPFTVAWAPNYKASGGGTNFAPTMTTNASAIDVFTFVTSRYNPTNLYGVPTQYF